MINIMPSIEVLLWGGFILLVILLIFKVIDDWCDNTDPICRPSSPDPSDRDGYDDSHEISAMMGHQGGMAIRQNREDPYR